MRFCRNCGYKARDVRFGNDKVNIQPTVQLLNKLKGYFDEIEHNKRVLIKEKDHIDDALQTLDILDDDLDGLIQFVKKIQNEIRKEL